MRKTFALLCLFVLLTITTGMAQPAAPINVKALPGENSVSLTWTANTESDLAFYKIYRIQNGVDTGQITSVQAPITNFIDTKLTNGIIYSYQIVAVNTGGVSGPLSAVVSATPIAMPPATPVGLTSIAGDKQVTLKWPANTERDLLSYKVYLLSATEPISQIGEVHAPATSFTHTGLVNGTIYFYAISAVGSSANESAKSASVFAIPKDVIPPSTPKGLAALNGDSEITLSWNPNTETDLSGYKIYFA